MSIELLAGIASQTKYRFELKQFLQDLRDNGFCFPNLKTLTSHTDKDLTISEHLAKLFEIADLSNEQILILANFQIIPKSLQVPLEFSRWIGNDDIALSELEKSRWISLSKNGYVMYDMVWEAVKLQLTNIPYENAETMIATMTSGDYFNAKDEHPLFAIKIQIADAYAKYFPDEDTLEWSDFLDLLGTKHRDKGEYDKALEYYEKALGIRETVLGKDHPSTATTYNNIAGVYLSMGEYDKVRTYFEKKFGKDSPNYNAIKEALESFQKQIKSDTC